MRRLLSAAAAAAALAALAGSATATIVLRVSPKELADTAPMVIEGRVATVDQRWDDGRTCINTYAVVNVDRTHKGPAAGSVTVKIPGGRVGDEEVRVEGTAKLEAGEDCLLFLWKDGKGEWVVLGEAQGKFRLWHDAKTGRRMAENSLKGLCLVVRGDAKKAEADGARKPDCLCYDDLVATVAASVEAQRKAAPSTGSTAAPAGGGTATGTGTGTTTTTTPAAPAPTSVGGVPAPQPAAPDLPSTSTTPGAGAPPPAKDAPAPPAGSSVVPGAGTQEPKPPAPAPEKR